MNEYADRSAVRIPIDTKNEVYTVSAAEIIMVEAQERRVMVYTTGGEYASVQNMQYWVEALRQECFFRTHRSYIVNMEYVSHFDHFLVHLCNGELRAYLTRRKYNEFKERYLQYMK